MASLIGVQLHLEDLAGTGINLTWFKESSAERLTDAIEIELGTLGQAGTVSSVWGNTLSHLLRDMLQRSIDLKPQ